MVVSGMVKNRGIKAWHVLVAIPVVCGVGGFAVSKSLESRSYHAVQQEIAKLKALGVPMEAKDFVRGVPYAENAAPLYQQAFEAYQRIGEVKPGLSIAPAIKRKERTAAEQAAMLRQVEALGEATKWLEEGAKRALCEFPRRWDDAPFTTWPEFNYSKSLVRVLCARAEVFMEKGDTAGAIRELRTAMRLAFHLRDKTLISVLVSIACDTIILNEVTYLVATFGTSSTFGAFDALLDEMPPRPDIREGVLGEPFFTHRSVDMLRKGDLKSWSLMTGSTDLPPYLAVMLKNPHFQNAVEVRVLSRIRAFLESTQDKDDEAFQEAASALDHETASDQSLVGQIASIFSPMYVSAAALPKRSKTQRVIAKATVWVYRERARLGKFPLTLPMEFADPYHPDQPLRLKPNGRFAQIYSVGPNGADDGGRRTFLPGSPTRSDDVELYVHSVAPKP